MEKSLQKSTLDPGIDEILNINCIEKSTLKNLFYVAGLIKSSKTRKSCPVVIINLENKNVEGM